MAVVSWQLGGMAHYGLTHMSGTSVVMSGPLFPAGLCPMMVEMFQENKCRRSPEASLKTWQ